MLGLYILKDGNRDFPKMGILVYTIVLLAGAYLALKFGNVYLAITWVGICLAYAIAARKLFWREAFKLIFFAIFSAVIMLGGGVIFARTWGVAFAFIWIVLCIFLLIIFGKRILRFFPTLLLAEQFQEVVSEALKKERENISMEGSDEKD